MEINFIYINHYLEDRLDTEFSAFKAS